MWICDMSKRGTWKADMSYIEDLYLLINNIELELVRTQPSYNCQILDPNIERNCENCAKSINQKFPWVISKGKIIIVRIIFYTCIYEKMIWLLLKKSKSVNNNWEHTEYIHVQINRSNKNHKEVEKNCTWKWEKRTKKNLNNEIIQMVNIHKLGG